MVSLRIWKCILAFIVLLSNINTTHSEFDKSFEGKTKRADEEQTSWLKIIKKFGVNLLSSKKSAALKKSIYEMTPQVLQDALKTEARGGDITQVIKERIKSIIETIESRLSRKDAMQSKQISFDPLVFGVNSLINLGWLAAFLSFVTPNMGLENLLNPDYDFDYEAYEQSLKPEAPNATTTSANDTISANATINVDNGEATEVSSYVYYSGQRMRGQEGPLFPERRRDNYQYYQERH